MKKAKQAEPDRSGQSRCGQCGEWFKPLKKSQRFCGAKCRQRHWYEANRPSILIRRRKRHQQEMARQFAGQCGDIFVGLKEELKKHGVSMEDVKRDAGLSKTGRQRKGRKST